MGEGKAQRFQDSWSQYCGGGIKLKDQWEAPANEDLDSSSPSISTPEGSTISNGSSASSSLETRDDASSSPPDSSFSNSSESIYDLSELVAQLPIKRGLSNFYQGKSESFTCLSRVTGVDDLKKKEMPCRKTRKVSKIYQAGLDTYKSFTLPKPTIFKKTPKASFSSSIFSSRTVSFKNSNRPPQIPHLDKDSRC